MPPLNRPAAGYTTDLNWRPALNTESEDAPPFGLVRVTGRDSAGVYTVAQPDTDGGPAWVNSPLAIAADSAGGGAISPDGPVDALYDSADGTPAVGETWGAGAGSWKLRKGMAGFVVVGTADADAELVPVLRDLTAASGSAFDTDYLESHYAITADSAWEDVGISVDLPGPGKYLIWGTAQAVLNSDDFSGGVAAVIEMRLRLTDAVLTAPDALPHGEVARATSENEYAGGFATIVCAIEISAATTLKMQAARNVIGATSPTWVASGVRASTEGLGQYCTFIGYMKLGSGAQGPAGADGADGDDGAPGATGPAGADGATNPESENGTIGIQVFGP